MLGISGIWTLVGGWRHHLPDAQKICFARRFRVSGRLLNPACLNTLLATGTQRKSGYTIYLDYTFTPPDVQEISGFASIVPQTI